MNKALVINLILYGILGFLLGHAGVTVSENPLTFVVILLLVIVIENVGRWDEISRRYRG